MGIFARQQLEIEIEDPNKFPAGAYVVMIHGCRERDSWPDLPVDHVYQLREESDTYTFRVDVGLRGGPNGWSLSKHGNSDYGKLQLRLATDQEIRKYIELGKPYDISILPKIPQIINNYSIY